MFWRMKEWSTTSELEKEVWLDLLDIRYKVQSDKKVKIKSKDEMLGEGIVSPDTADSLSLTFYDREINPKISNYKQPEYESSSFTS